MERIDLYDKNRNKLNRTEDRSTYQLKDDEFMLYVLALIERSDHTFLITRRSLNKHWAAGWWEIPGGGAMTGETSYQAVRREVKEETGLLLPEEPVSPIYSYCNQDPKHHDNYFCDIYHVHFDFKDCDVHRQKSEVLDWTTADWNQITALSTDPGFLHYLRIKQALEQKA